MSTWNTLKPKPEEDVDVANIRELYEWAVASGVEELPIGLQYQDKGDFYDGDTFNEEDSVWVTARIEKSNRGKYVLLI